MLPLLFFLHYMSIQFPILPSGKRHFPDKDNLAEEGGTGDLGSSLLGEKDGECMLVTDTDTDEGGGLARLSSACSSADIIGLRDTCDDAETDPSDHVAAPARPSFWEEIQIVVGYPCYIYITLGYGALTAVLIGLATFGSSFFLGLSLFDSEVAASTAFGAIVSIAGVLGFPIGGLLVDTLVKKHKKECDLTGGTSKHADLLMSSLVMTVSGTVGLALYCLLYFVRSKTLFVALIFVATTAIFVCNAATSVGLIYSIPIVNRPFGIAFNAIVMHLIGTII